MTNLDAHETQRPAYLPSPLLSGSYSPESVSYSGPVTPPASTASSTIDILEPEFRATHVYTPNSMSGDYVRTYDYNDGSPQRRDSTAYSQGSNSPTRRSPGHCSPKSTSSREGSAGRYHYTPYGLEKRPSTPHHYSGNEGLPWQSSGPIVLPPAFPSPPSCLPYYLPRPSYRPPPVPPPPHHSLTQSAGHFDRSRYNDDVLGSTSGFKCPRCRHTAGSLEQLTKHQQKHQKIHHCRFEGCSRTEGFATPNDRERHEKSVHKIPGHYWKCLDESCSSYGKEFSRRDNLKDHLRRMHPLPEGLSEAEAGLMRSKQADNWRFEKSGPVPTTRH